jgi:hypothetical protein
MITHELKPFDAALARAVLADCEAALHVLKGNPRGVYWRLAWCSALTLLRAVGHVLEYEMRSPDAVPDMREAWEHGGRELATRRQITRSSGTSSETIEMRC